MKDKLKVDKAALDRLCDRKVQEAYRSRISAKRERVLDYYNQKLPKRQHEGGATYTTSTVYDACETSKAQLLELFGNDDLFSFEPLNKPDVEPARIATEYTRWVFEQANPGWQIKQALLHDAHLAPFSILKVYWSDEEDAKPRKVEGLTEEAVQALLSDPAVKSGAEAEQDSVNGLWSASYREIISDTSQVKLEVIAPEDFYIDPYARNVNDAFHYQRAWKTRVELKNMGLDVSKLDQLADAQEDEYSFPDLEKNARLARYEIGMSDMDDTEDDELTRRYCVHECYVHVDIDIEDRIALMKLIRVGKKTLHVEEVKRTPFKLFSLLPRAHTVFGDIFAERMIPYQNATTVLSRSVIDQANHATTQKYLVRVGGLSNPKELMNPRLGGIIQTTMDGAVQPMPTVPLNNYVFPLMSKLQADGESTSGISQLAMGQNKEAISNQNSTQALQDMVTLGMTRGRVAGRNFGDFLKEVFIEIYNLIIENDTRIIPNAVQLAGNWIDIDPKTWVERKNARIREHLSRGENDAQADKLMGGLTMMSQDPTLRRMMGEMGGYNVAVDWLRLKGFKNYDAYITSPDKIPPAQPDPMAVKTMELNERTVALEEMKAQNERMKIMMDAEAKGMKHTLEEMKFIRDLEHKGREADRKDLETASRIDMADREMTKLENEPVQVKGLVDPR